MDVARSTGPISNRSLRALTVGLVAAIALAGGLGNGATVGFAAAADPSADIPGIPLPAPVVTGQLGGPIYDVVYRLEAPPASVIVASLSGPAGTDFDLYLYDSTATTVTSETGLVARSTGPTSTESLSVPTRLGGTYYLDLYGASDVEGTYRLAVQVVADQTPPTLSIALNGGRPATNQLTVPVALSAADDLSGVTEMAFSPDGLAYGSWQPFQRTTAWTFPPGDGVKTLWAKVRNGAGLESAPARASVTLDTVAPSATAIDPAPGSTVGLQPRFTVTFDEPIDPASWQRLGLVVQAASGELVDGDYGYDAARREGSFVPASTLQPGGTYVVTLGSVTDVAGNVVAPRGSWTVFPLSPTSLDVRADPRAVAVGGSARLDALLTGAPSPAVLGVGVVSAGDGAGDGAGAAPEVVPLTTVLVQGGRATLVVSPGRNTVYRLTYDGATGIAPASADVRVLVRRSVGLLGVGGTTVSRASIGRPVKLVAAVAPAAAGVSVSFRLYRYDPGRRAWVYAGSRGRATDQAGRASYTWTPTVVGSWYWRVAVASTADYANNVSPVYRWSVGR